MWESFEVKSGSRRIVALHYELFKSPEEIVVKKKASYTLTPYLRILSIVLTVILFIQGTPLIALDTTLEQSGDQGIELLAATRAMPISEVPESIRGLLDKESGADTVYLVTDPDDEAEPYTLRSENSLTGEGTLTVHSVPVKYTDSEGELQFIDTSMKSLNSGEAATRGFAYRNAANAFSVEFGATAVKGINFNNAFTIGVLTQRDAIPEDTSSVEKAESGLEAGVDPEMVEAELLTDDIDTAARDIVEENNKDSQPIELKAEKTGDGTITASKAAVGRTDSGAGNIVYSEAFGPQTSVEYINTESGVKENIILDKNTGQNRFEYLFQSETHIPIITENGSNILVADKHNPDKIEYRFLSLYAYDSFKPEDAGENSTGENAFRHLTNDCYYELADNKDGTYTVTVVVPEEYLNHPEVVYPITIDPSITHTATAPNSSDSYVSEAYPNANYGWDAYMHIGRESSKRVYSYQRFLNLPSASGLTGSSITSAY